MKDHRRVEKILAEAGRCSHGESMYEAGPQAVTQVSIFCWTQQQNVLKYDVCHPEGMFANSTDGPMDPDTLHTAKGMPISNGNCHRLYHGHTERMNGCFESLMSEIVKL